VSEQGKEQCNVLNINEELVAVLATSATQQPPGGS